MIKVVTGPMFSGKSNAISEIYNNMWNKEIIACFKPKVDTRDYGKIKVRNNDNAIDALVIEYIEDLKEHLTDKIKTVFIDEFQFLKGDVNIIVELSMFFGIDFYISGLARTSELKPFGLMPNIMAVADEIIHLSATCYYCNKPASFTFYRGNLDKGEILVGNDEYVPTCQNCYVNHYNKI